MVLITKVFVIMLLASLVGMLAFTVTTDYYNEYDVTMSDDMEALSGNFTNTKTTGTQLGNETSDSFTSSSGSSEGFLTQLVSTGYNTFTTLFNNLGQIDTLITSIGNILNIPSYVINIFYTMILISFVVALALILMRLGVF